jgi:saccharopine dehydrogenase (NAD+, L-lysine-forming)
MELALRHPDGYQFTAIPVAACIMQYLDGSARQPGLRMMGHAVDPARLLHDMVRMGIEIDEGLI